MAGEYRPILVEHFKKAGNDELAEAVGNKTLMIAITGSIQGNVKKREDLTNTFIEGLQGDDYDSVRYRAGLSRGTMVPVVSFNGKTAPDSNRVYGPGELYFGS